MILFSEAALTGLINNDDPSHDLPLGQAIPGPATDNLSSFCRCHGVWMAIGMLEREDGRLFDSAVLLDPRGTVCLKYRRNQPQWHGRNADPTVYCQGTEIPMINTPFGSLAFLVCGDVFDDEIVARFRNLQPDWLLFPFARCFSDGSCDEDRWDREELSQYLNRVKLTGTPALMTNYLGDRSLSQDSSFGGAFFVSREGELLGRLPLGEEGMLIIDMKERRTIESPVLNRRALRTIQNG